MQRNSHTLLTALLLGVNDPIFLIEGFYKIVMGLDTSNSLYNASILLFNE